MLPPGAQVPGGNVANELAVGIDQLDKRAALARIFIYLYVAASLATILSDLGQLGGAFVLEDGSPAALLGVGAYLAVFLIYLASVIFVAMWIHRAHANLFEAGLEGLEFSPGWSVGWFFVPIANLFKPFQAMREVWNRSHGHDDGYNALTPSDLGAWWGCFIVGNILINIATNMESYATEGSHQTGLVLGIAASTLLIGSAWFLKKIIDATTSAQRSMVGIAETFA